MSDINTIEKEALAAIEAAGDLAALDDVRVAELGKKGRVSGLMSSLGKMSPEERKEKQRLAYEAGLEKRRLKREEEVLALGSYEEQAAYLPGDLPSGG